MSAIAEELCDDRFTEMQTITKERMSGSLYNALSLKKKRDRCRENGGGMGVVEDEVDRDRDSTPRESKRQTAESEI